MLYGLRRWWDRYGLTLALGGVAIAVALMIRQTKGLVLFEIYGWATQPFQAQPPPEETLASVKILNLQARISELESQNRSLRQLVGYVTKLPKPSVTAPVVGRSADQWWQQLLLGRGSQDGIREGDVATSVGGLVGRVIAVTPHTSRVLLISDPSSRVGVTIGRSRSTGFVRGQAGRYAVMKFFDKVPDVHRGDVVTTSSLSQLFPAGVPVGRIESVDLRKSPVPEARVELSTLVSSLEWVVVYPNQSPPQ
jgi:rod shape-determining protein MreC